jgi:hypothetical protein
MLTRSGEKGEDRIDETDKTKQCGTTYDYDSDSSWNKINDCFLSVVFYFIQRLIKLK